MPDESAEQKKMVSASSQPSERGGRREASSRTGEHGHGHGRHRRRRRHKATKARSKATIVAFAALVLIVGAGLFFAIGPRLVGRWNAFMGRHQQTGESKDFVRLTYRTVIIMNASTNDWGNTTVVVNDEYEAHCPDIPKGTQFEIRLKDFRGPQGPFEPTAPTVKRVTVKPEGQEPIVWDRWTHW